METVGRNSAVIVWELPSLKNQHPSGRTNADQLSWKDFREEIEGNHPQLDAACSVILSDPIAFNLNARGRSMSWVTPQDVLWSLMRMFGSRTILALHDGNLDAAWTNVLAATRLVTAWNSEPSELSHIARFSNTSLAFNAIWQTLQNHDWQDRQLAQLQTEWESVDFFMRLPETAALERAADVAQCERDVNYFLLNRMRSTQADFFLDFLRYPPLAGMDLANRWQWETYVRQGRYEDEEKLLWTSRDREIALRNAVRAATWFAMRKHTGATNFPDLQSPYGSSRISREWNITQRTAGVGLLGSAAKAETQRRLIVTALALERYRARHGSYPANLSELAPEFLKHAPVDFMDGQPLRYHTRGDNNFILYSVGLDCVDHGGTFQRLPPYLPGSAISKLYEAIVWPLPVPPQDVERARVEEVELRRKASHHYPFRLPFVK